MNTAEIAVAAIPASLVLCTGSVCLTARYLLRRGFTFTFTVAPEAGARPWSQPQPQPALRQSKYANDSWTRQSRKGGRFGSVAAPETPGKAT